MHQHRVLSSKYGGLSLGDIKDTEDFKYFTYADFPQFSSEHENALSKVLNNKMFQKLKGRKTANEVSLSNIIQVGVECPYLKLGLAAGDSESYKLFEDLFYKVVEKWSGVNPKIRKNASDLNFNNVDLSELQRLDVGKYILSTRMRSIRNIFEYPFPSGTNDQIRIEVDGVLKKILKKFKGYFSGLYYSVSDLSEADLNNLRKREYLFNEPNPRGFIVNSGCARRWPKSRGVFSNDKHNVFCWCNEEDHCCIISFQDGYDIKSVFQNFAELSRLFVDSTIAVGKSVAWDDRLGYLTTCPTNLGTGFRANVKMNIPKLVRNRNTLNEICDKHFLEARSSRGKGKLSGGNILEISNKRRIGLTETELLQSLVNGLVKIINAEEKM